MADDNPFTNRPPPPDIDPLAIPDPPTVPLEREIPRAPASAPTRPPPLPPGRTLLGVRAPSVEPPAPDLGSAKTLAAFGQQAAPSERRADSGAKPLVEIARNAIASRGAAAERPRPVAEPAQSSAFAPPTSPASRFAPPKAAAAAPVLAEADRAAGASAAIAGGSSARRPPNGAGARPDDGASPSTTGGFPAPSDARYPGAFGTHASNAGLGRRLSRWLRDYFLVQEPRFWSAVVPFIAIAVVLFARSPATNYIFDEQEALLANPYVNRVGGLRWVDAIHRDFWGLAPDRSVGSYRPIPNLLWRLLWGVSKAPFFHHIYNVLFHAAVAALIVGFVYRLTRRAGLSWTSGVLFLVCGVLTEAVTGIVGIADVLGGLGAVLALIALALPAWSMPLAVFSAVLFGLFCKESALVCVPLVPFAALVAAPLTHPERPARGLRALLALIGAACAFILYVELRKRWFPSPLPSELTQDLPAGASRLQRYARDFLIWFHQAPLPKDPLNNPLAEADPAHRIAGALRVYWRGIVQIVFPKTLSGDYSFPQEPIPERLVFPESIAGAAMMIGPAIVSLALWGLAVRQESHERARLPGRSLGQGRPYREWADSDSTFAGLPETWFAAMLRPTGGVLLGIIGGFVVLDALVFRPRGQFVGFHALSWWAQLLCIAGPMALALGMIAEGGPRVAAVDPPDRIVPMRRAGLVLTSIGLMWMVVSYFPHSNIPVVLPTVRAERFWYFPAIGTCLVLGVVFTGLCSMSRRTWWTGIVAVAFAAFIGFQGVQAYRHAMDYRNDVDFWEATKEAVPNSAKAHLNYSVMKGARGDLDLRLRESKIALTLAPKWPMAHVYTGDTLCRMHRAEEAWPYYREGFDIGPNELSLIALGLQCLYDEKKLKEHEDELKSLADKHPSSWIAYLAIDTLENGDKYGGVDPKYRPRGYNEGPKDN